MKNKMKNKMKKIFIYPTFMFLVPAKSIAFEFSHLGLNIFDANVSVDSKYWSFNKQSSGLESYQTTETVKKDFSDVNIMAVVVKRNDKKHIDWIAKWDKGSNRGDASIVSKDGVVVCTTNMGKGDNYCDGVKASTCNKIKDRLAKMTAKGSNECIGLIKLVHRDEGNTEINQLKTSLQSAFPAFPMFKNLSFRNPGKFDLGHAIDVCQEYSRLNPKVGGRERKGSFFEFKDSPNKKKGVKSDSDQ